MPSSRCGTGHASSGESAWAAQPNRARRLSTRSPTLPHRRVANAAMTPATGQGRKRHIAVDTLGLLPAMTVTTASVQDRDGAVDVVAQACRTVPAIERLQTDGAYAGQCAGAIERTHGIRVEREFQELLAFRSFCMTHVST